MKKFLIVFLMMCFTLPTMAFQDQDMNINAGAGIFGSRGLLGVSLDRFFTPNHALSASFGADIIGISSSIGYKYFTNKMNTSKTIWDKCWFIFDCNSHTYLGAGLQYAGKTTLTISEGDTELRAYDINPKWLGIASIGFRDVYKSNFTMDVEISYRSLFAGGESVQTFGSSGNDQKSLELGLHSMGINIALGYIF